MVLTSFSEVLISTLLVTSETPPAPPASTVASAAIAAPEESTEAPPLDTKHSDEALAGAKSVIDNKDLIDLSTYGILRNKMKVPELRGLSLRKAIFTLNKSKLKFNVDGSGKVIWQSPKPGSLVPKGSTISMGLN